MPKQAAAIRSDALPPSTAGSPDRSVLRPQVPAQASAPASALPAAFAGLFAKSVPRIIGYQDSRSRAELSLQTDAAVEGLTPPEMKAYLPAALAQLDILTAEQAARYHVTPAQYAAWRQAYPAP